MIIGLSTIQDEGAGFRTRVFMPRWNWLKNELLQINFPQFEELRIRLVIGDVESGCAVQGFEDEMTFVVESRIPIEHFKQFSIREKNDLVLDTIFESIKAAYTHFSEPPPPAIDQIWQEVRALP